MAESFTSSSVIGQQPSGEEDPLFGDVANTDDEALFVQRTGIYQDFYTNHRYETDHHIYMMSIASPNGFQGAKAGFVQLASPVTLLLVDWSVEHLAEANEYPDYPDPASLADDNTIHMDTIVEPATLTLSPDGRGVVKRISGTYVYGFKDPVQASLRHGRSPIMNPTIPQGVDDNKKVTGLI